MTRQRHYSEKQKRDPYEKFNQAIIEALTSAEDQSLDSIKLTAIATYTVCEFALFHSRGNFNIVSGLILEILCTSGFRRIDLPTYSETNKIIINAKNASLEDRANPASLLLLTTALMLLEDFAEKDTGRKIGLH